MTDQGSPSAAARMLRDALAAADRKRRARDAAVRLWKAAPWGAAAGLLAAAVAWWARWPALLPAALLALGLVSFAVFAIVSRRAQPVSDAAAAAIDDEAALGGELRSAGWFAERAVRDDWADLHLERAADRLRGVDWTALYPAPQTLAPRLATAAMTLAALALTATIPARVAVEPVAAAEAAPQLRKVRADLRNTQLALSPEMLKQLEALLAAVERGDKAAADALASNADLRDALNALSQLKDQKQLEALAKAMAAADGQKAPNARELARLADRARKAAENAAVPKDMKDALEKLADELDAAQSGASKGDEESTSASSSPKQAAGNESGANASQDMSIQFAKDADAAGGAGVMMMANPDEGDSSGPPGAGVGGAGSQDQPGAATAGIEAALKEELVEASQDNPGSNVETDIRRKTEHGDATVGFSRGAAATFDRSRTAAPPPVPEARRSGVQTYFIRK